MRNKYPARFMLVAGFLSVAGCGGSEPTASESGGMSGLAAASGRPGDDAGGTAGSVLSSGGTSATDDMNALGGMNATGGAAPAAGGTLGGGVAGAGDTSSAAGGSSNGGTGGAVAVGGMPGIGGGDTSAGGSAMGGAGPAAGGATAFGGRAGGPDSTGGAGASGAATGGSSGTGPCTATASKAANVTAMGTGPHQVVVETNADSKMSCATIYRPSDLGGSEKYPIYVWAEGGCSRSGTSNRAAMAEIASHGYFVIADGPPSGGNCPSISMPNSYTDLLNMAKPMLDYVSWAIAQNGESCSAYYDSLDTTKVAADGFSCGGLMAEGTAGDSRMTAWGISSSGLTSKYQDFYKTIHTPVKILLGGSGDVAYSNGESDYTNISALGIPVILLSKDGAGHGGDLSNGTGAFNSVNLAWLNWQLKGDMSSTGKGALYGSDCKYCNASGWEYKSANIE